ncbi:MAG: divalent-cation tolerance protein CutA [Pseudomonadota bacterium]
MRTAKNFRIVFSTVGNQTNALKIARALLSARAAACVNMVRGLRSIYRWKGRIQNDAEVLLIVKTTVKKLPDVEKIIRKTHTYEVPEIVSLPLDRGSERYLRWVEQETTKKGRS